ncbi:hypothetical protein ACFP1Z_27790 [Streptomyces gamaensis]|uniref:Secreted protein n=1 Tax=Streptomyces gamaensis TaxID=1763542 RepID=A0ABW0Z584_9ACTN
MYVPRTLVALGTAAVIAAVTAGAAPGGAGTAHTAAERPAPGRAAKGPAFAQLSSAVDQEQDGRVKPVQFELVDGRRGVDVTKDSVTVRHPGTYLLVVAPQVTTEKGGVQKGKDPTEGCADTWFAVNDKDVPNSAVRLCQAATHSTHVVVSQSVTPLKAGDTVKVRAKGVGVKFDATRPTDGPLIPSVILTLTELS